MKNILIQKHLTLIGSLKIKHVGVQLIRDKTKLEL